MLTFEPLKLAPKELRKRYALRAQRAEHSYKSAIELKCVECAGWERSEAKRCQITSCPLWAANQRVFRGSSAAEQEDGLVTDSEG
jgi:hypothetical protein